MLAPLTFFVVVVIGGLPVLVALAGGGVLSVVCAALLLVVLCVAVYDLVQRKHSILRNYPVAVPFLFEAIRPEIQQYFIERNYDGRRYDRDARDVIHTQGKRRARALDVSDTSRRVFRFQQGTVTDAQQISGSMGLRGPSEIEPWMLIRRVDEAATRSYAELHEWLERDELLASPRQSWATDWRRAAPDSFQARSTGWGESHADRR
jgi:hypothetical protein